MRKIEEMGRKVSEAEKEPTLLWSNPAGVAMIRRKKTASFPIQLDCPSDGHLDVVGTMS